jgi:hypothetical protein
VDAKRLPTASGITRASISAAAAAAVQAARTRRILINIVWLTITCSELRGRSSISLYCDYCKQSILLSLKDLREVDISVIRDDINPHGIMVRTAEHYPINHSEDCRKIGIDMQHFHLGAFIMDGWHSRT